MRRICSSGKYSRVEQTMAASDRELEAQLLESGNQLVDPPESVDELLPLLDVSPNFLSWNFVFTFGHVCVVVFSVHGCILGFFFFFLCKNILYRIVFSVSEMALFYFSFHGSLSPWI